MSKRIVVVSIDGIGDAVLREPMLSAWAAAGHHLLVIVSPPVEPVLRQFCPAAEVVVCATNPYQETRRHGANFPEELFRRVAAFEPDLLVVAAFQWTNLERALARRFPALWRIGFTGHLLEAELHQHDAGLEPLDFNQQVIAAADEPEIKKNQRLAEAVLGHPLERTRPQLNASPEQTARGRQLLAAHGLEPDSFWLVNCGTESIYYYQLKSWPEKKWAAVLDHLAEHSRRRLVLAGSAGEARALARVRSRMARPDAAVVLITNELDEWIGLAQFAFGYLGKDAGPMHLAAALGKPVVAIFGGGHWPRFVPVAAAGVTLTVEVPCAGCNWCCYRADSVCVKDVAVADVRQAVDDIEAGRVRGAEIRTRPVAPERLIVSAPALNSPARADAAQGNKVMEQETASAELQLENLRVENSLLKQRLAQDEIQKRQAAGEPARLTALEQELAEVVRKAVERENAQAERDAAWQARVQTLTDRLQRMEEDRDRQAREQPQVQALREQLAEMGRRHDEQHQLAQDLSRQLGDLNLKYEEASRNFQQAQEHHDNAARLFHEAQAQLVKASESALAEREALQQELAAAHQATALEQARVKELAEARSRRALIKLRLVHRCAWEVAS